MNVHHTPGPWELSNGARIYAPGKAGPLLATVAYLPKTPGQEMANARLMAAAPELLEAVVRYLADREEAGCTADSAAVKAMRAAAAKAKGAT